MSQIYDETNSEIILAELPENEQGPFMEWLFGQTIPAPRPGDPPGTVRAYRWDYERWKQGWPVLD